MSIKNDSLEKFFKEIEKSRLFLNVKLITALIGMLVVIYLFIFTGSGRPSFYALLVHVSGGLFMLALFYYSVKKYINQRFRRILKKMKNNTELNKANRKFPIYFKSFNANIIWALMFILFLFIIYFSYQIYEVSFSIYRQGIDPYSLRAFLNFSGLISQLIFITGLPLLLKLKFTYKDLSKKIIDSIEYD